MNCLACQFVDEQGYAKVNTRQGHHGRVENFPYTNGYSALCLAAEKHERLRFNPLDKPRGKNTAGRDDLCEDTEISSKTKQNTNNKCARSRVMKAGGAGGRADPAGKGL